MIAWIIGSKLGRTIAAIGAALLAAWAALASAKRTGRKEGKAEERADATTKDRKRADEIRDINAGSAGKQWVSEADDDGYRD